MLRDIILSGFELELYMHDERPFAYWYLAQISQLHVSVVGDVIENLPEGANYLYYVFNVIGYSL